MYIPGLLEEGGERVKKYKAEDAVKTSHERVLCFPRNVLSEEEWFQGFRPDHGELFERIIISGKASFVERKKAEEDPSLKQLIPYVVMKHGERLLFYVRGNQTGEQRLRDLGSVGIGGHISVTDHSLFEREMRDIFFSGLKREVEEEVTVKSSYRERVKGFINDDSNAVGRVHLGVLIIRELVSQDVSKRERSITSLEFLGIDELRARRGRLETWSQIVVDNWEKLA